MHNSMSFNSETCNHKKGLGKINGAFWEQDLTMPGLGYTFGHCVSKYRKIFCVAYS